MVINCSGGTVTGSVAATTSSPLARAADGSRPREGSTVDRGRPPGTAIGRQSLRLPVIAPADAR